MCKKNVDLFGIYKKKFSFYLKIRRFFDRIVRKMVNKLNIINQFKSIRLISVNK